MAARVHVHAAIWIGDRLVVHRRLQRGQEHLTLPGGRVKDRETVTEALRREALEEIGCAIEMGELLLAAEVAAMSRHAVVLVFAATAAAVGASDSVLLLDPASATADGVLPPVVPELVTGRSDAPPMARWLGNLHRAAPSAAVPRTVTRR